MPGQVQEPVDSQSQQLFLQGMAKLLRLRPGGLRGDQNFAFLFPQAETEHIGSPVKAKKLSVVSGNPLVAYQDDAELSEGEAGDLKRLVYLPAETFYVYFYFALEVA